MHWIYYALTFRKVRKPITISDYYDELERLKKLDFRILDVNFEDTKGLHVHCVLGVNHEEDAFLKQRGWNYKLVPIYYHRGWLKYATKDLSQDIENKYKMLELYESASEQARKLDQPPEEEEHEDVEKEIQPPTRVSCLPQSDGSQSDDDCYKKFKKRVKNLRLV